MFPKSTELPQKFISKEKFYVNGDFGTKLKIAMTKDIAKIAASNKISATTLNITAGKTFPEIMVLRVVLKNKKYDIKLLDAIDKSIRAAFVLFVLDYNDEKKLSIAFKDKNGDKITLAKRWTTDWQEDFVLELSGRSIDAVYEGFIQQISGGKLVDTYDKSLKEKVVHAINNDKIEKQIARLETKMKNEPQLKKKLEIKAEIKKIKEQL